MRHYHYTLFFSLTVCYVAAFIGSAFTTPSITTWYAYLQKPFFNPPNWVFGPVWTLLYTMMGYSLHLILSVKKHQMKERAVIVFALQLILNILWSLVFFGLHFPGIALIVIVALWIAIFESIRVFSMISTRASSLLIPYLCWVSFASILNGAIVILN